MIALIKSKVDEYFDDKANLRLRFLKLSTSCKSCQTYQRKPNEPNQPYQTKPAKSNLPKQTKLTTLNQHGVVTTDLSVAKNVKNSTDGYCVKCL